MPQTHYSTYHGLERHVLKHDADITVALQHIDRNGNRRVFTARYADYLDYRTKAELDHTHRLALTNGEVIQFVLPPMALYIKHYTLSDGATHRYLRDVYHALGLTVACTLHLRRGDTKRMTHAMRLYRGTFTTRAAHMDRVLDRDLFVQQTGTFPVYQDKKNYTVHPSIHYIAVKRYTVCSS